MSNLHMVTYVADRLGSLIEHFVFVGGSIVELLLDKDYPLDQRITKDVDVIIKVYDRGSFSRVESVLRKQGFKNDVTSGVICRWDIDGVQLDIMPTNTKILGFGNRWYQSAIKYAKKYSLKSKLDIMLITAPYFIATKLEAFSTRGSLDFMLSHDFEDIITVLDGRSALVNEFQNIESDVKQYVQEMFRQFINNQVYWDSLPGHFAPYGDLMDARLQLLTKKIEDIVSC